jgi:hypothetical protein
MHGATIKIIYWDFVLCHRGYFNHSIANKYICFLQVLKMDLQEFELGGGGGLGVGDGLKVSSLE